jgi:hypothetical protein
VVTTGGGSFTDPEIFNAMRRVATAPGVQVANVSIGWSSGCASSGVQASIRKWVRDSERTFRQFLGGVGKNVVWTFSAGNNCIPGPSSPWGAIADRSNVITVAATNSDQALASFSNYPDSSASGNAVEVAAPGGVSTNPLTGGLKSSIARGCPVGYCGGYGDMAGTSMAAPLVAGVASLARAKNPKLTADQIGDCITSTAGTNGVGSTIGRSTLPAGYPLRVTYTGRSVPIVNAAAAVDCAGAAASLVGQWDGINYSRQPDGTVAGIRVEDWSVNPCFKAGMMSKRNLRQRSDNQWWGEQLSLNPDCSVRGWGLLAMRVVNQNGIWFLRRCISPVGSSVQPTIGANGSSNVSDCLDYTRVLTTHNSSTAAGKSTSPTRRPPAVPNTASD